MAEAARRRVLGEEEEKRKGEETGVEKGGKSTTMWRPPRARGITTHHYNQYALHWGSHAMGQKQWGRGGGVVFGEEEKKKKKRNRRRERVPLCDAHWGQEA
jgi:hypothetical protein